MKASTFTVAFFVSTAIHAGVLSSNLLHVSAGSFVEKRTRTVKLHIVSPAPVALAPSPPQPVERITTEKSPETHSEVPDVNRPKRIETMQRDAPAVKTSKADVFEEASLPDKPPVSVRNEDVPTADSIVHPAQVSEVEPDLKQEAAVSTESRDESSDIRHTGHSLESDQNGLQNAHASSQTASASIPVQGPQGTGSRKSVLEMPATIDLSSKPNYPRYSRLHNEEGTAVLSVEILFNGELGNVELVQSSGYRRLDEAAVKGIQKAKLIPAVKDGKKVTSVKRIAIKFDLEDWGE